MFLFLGTFLTISEENVSDMLGYIGDIVSDLMPLMLPIMAVGIGLIIVYAIIHAIKGK